MKQKTSLLVFLLFFSCSLVWTQEWSREDSVWLKNVLDGTEELKINEETKKAIEDGRLFVPPWMQQNDKNSIFDLLQDFDNSGMPDDSLKFHRIDPFSMSPSIFAMYVLYLDKMDSVFGVKSLVITDNERKQLEDLLPTGTVRAIYFNTSGYSPGFGITTDFNHLLSMVFSAQYRRIAHNRKHATAYKNYYDHGPAAGPIRFTEYDRKQLMQSVNSYKMPVRVSFGQKKNGIDD